MSNKKFFLPAILLFLVFNARLCSQSLNEIIKEVKNAPGFRNCEWGMYAEFTDNGEQVLNSDGQISLAPASNLKLLTSSAALYYLGEDFRFATEIYLRGNITPEGTLNGDIIIRGGGDPALGSSQAKGSLNLDSLMKQWTSAVTSLGIKKINGSVTADDFLFDRVQLPDYYPWIDMGNYYGAGTSALTINENLYYLFFKPSDLPGMPAEVLRTEPPVEGLVFRNYMKTGKPGSGDNGYIYAAPKQFNAELRGTIPAGVEEFSIKGSIPDPPLFAVQHFSKYLRNAGIEITGLPFVTTAPVQYKDLRKIFTTVSPPLRDIVYIINKKSNNLYTEQVLKMTAVKFSGEGSTDRGIEAIRKYLSDLGVPDEGLELFDGSGLSRNNFITPYLMCRMLSAVTRQKFFNSFNNSLGLAGDPEDISAFKDFGANTIIAFNTRIKSGTINGVHSHSGYIKTKKGRLVSFSFIANNFTGSNREVNEAHLRILKAIAGQY